MKRWKRMQVLLLLLAAAVLYSGCGSKSAPPRETIPVESLDEAAVKRSAEFVEQITADVAPIIEEYLDEDGFVAPEDQEAALQEISEYAKELYEQGQITDYSYEPGDTAVYMRIDGWLTVLYDVPMEEYMTGGDSAPEIVTLEPNATEFTASYVLSGMGGPVEAASMVAAAFPEFTYQRAERNEEVTVESFRREVKNGILILCGHGNYVSELGSVIFTGIKAYDQATILLYTQEFGDEAIVMGSKGQFYLTPRFFDKYVPEDLYEGSLIYLGSCSSMADDRLLQSLFDRGARAVIGNDDVIWTPYNYGMIASFFDGLSRPKEGGSYRTVSEALEYAREREGESDPNLITDACVVAYYLDDFTLPQLTDVVDRGYVLSEKAVLRVTGLDNALYDNYTLRIEGQALSVGMGPMLSSEAKRVDRTILVDRAEDCALELEMGRYTFTITDNADPEKTMSFLVTVDRDGSEELNIETEFGGLAMTADTLVTDAYSDCLHFEEYDDLLACYHIPRINLEGWQTEEVNEDILREMMQILEQDVYTWDYPLIDSMSYAWNANSDVISVVIRTTDSSVDWDEYHVYNISAKTGEMIGRQELMARLGLGEKDFQDAARAAVEAYWESRDWAQYHIDEAYCEDLLRQTLSDENIMYDAQAWMNADGELCFIVGIYVPAGGGYYYYLLDTEGNPLELDFDCGVTHVYVPAQKPDVMVGSYRATYENVQITIKKGDRADYLLTYTDLSSGISLVDIPLAHYNSNTDTDKVLMFFTDEMYPEHSGYIEVCWDSDSTHPYSYNAILEGLEGTDGYYTFLDRE